MSRAHPSRSSAAGSLKLRFRSVARLTSACLTNHDTMPGFAPQQEIAVVPPGFFAFSSRTVVRSALLVRASAEAVLSK